MMEQQANLEAPPRSVKQMCEISYDIATRMVNLLSAMWQIGLLGENLVSSTLGTTILITV